MSRCQRPDFKFSLTRAISWGFAFLTYLIFALKTNAVFAGIFLTAAVAVWVLAGAYFKTATGDYTAAGTLQTVRQHDEVQASEQKLTNPNHRPPAPCSSSSQLWVGGSSSP